MAGMKTLISNTTIIPMTAEGYSLKGDIGIDGNKIAFTGTCPKGFVADKTVDGSSFIAMPALVNAHTHLSMELMRNYKDFAHDLQDWLGEIFPIEAKLTETDILHASRLGIMESIQSGITTFNDMYFFQGATARAANEGGIRACIGLTLFGDLASTKERIEQGMRQLALPMERSDGRVRLCIAPHAIYTCSDETYRYGHDWAREHGMPFHTHLAETRKEVEDCLAEHGKTPARYLYDLGCLEGTGNVLAHCVHMTKEDISLLAETGSTVVHNPSSNCKLASGIAPIASFAKAGINIALGTDGSSSNNNQNMFEEMHVASLLSTVSTMDPTAVSPYEILAMATINGAKAFGLDSEIGTLEPGKDADLILVDIEKSHLTPLNDPFSALVFSAQASDVDTVFCRGKVVMEHRQVCSLPLRKTMDQANATWKEILER
jgi:5-methylthioadenosine/S-adenosylhomocysteine deaminase